MAVTVVLHRYTTGAVDVDLYEKGVAFFVRESGHLVVLDAEHDQAKLIGAYPPGGWISVDRDNARSFATRDVTKP